jgi:hypothetical protein
LALNSGLWTFRFFGMADDLCVVVTFARRY